MKPFVLLALALFLFASCGSLSSFESPNHLRNVDGVLYLANGKSFEGKLIIQTGALFGSDVKLYLPGEKAPMHFTLQDVKGYSIGTDQYVLKERENGFGARREYLFMKQLTPADSRLHLYETQEREPQSGKGSRSIRYQIHFYIQWPQADGLVYAINGPRLVPHFERKMSEAVADCPALARKIAAKADGYFYAQLSLIRTKDRDVLLRIIDEYNRCGK